MATNGPRIKRLTYRDQGSASLEAHAAHWEGFEFASGHVQVVLSGKWGKPQVWASSEAEGKRVLLHAAAIASYDPSADPSARWEVADVSGRGTADGLTYGVRQLRWGPAVAKRIGPSGAPEYAEPTP